MNRRSFFAALTPIVALAAPVMAQGPAGEASGRLKPGAAKPDPAEPGAPGNPAKPAKPAGPTEITSRDATLDNKANVAVFGGDVEVKSPEYNVNCDKLTIYLKKEKEKPKPGDPKPAPAKEKEGEDDGQSNSRIDTAIAEGNVKILQIKPAVGNAQPEKYYGTGKRAVFENDKQVCTLTGWPRVKQSVGPNLEKEIVSLEESCVIVMSPDRIRVHSGLFVTRLIDLPGNGGNGGNQPAPGGLPR